MDLKEYRTHIPASRTQSILAIYLPGPWQLTICFCMYMKNLLTWLGLKVVEHL